jgi:hypothetical protein
VVVVRFDAVYVVAVLAISVKPVVKPELVADCHLVILPVCPLKVSTVLFVPEHTDAPPLILPPTEVADTTPTTANVFAVAPVEAKEIFPLKEPATVVLVNLT